MIRMYYLPQTAFTLYLAGGRCEINDLVLTKEPKKEGTGHYAVKVCFGATCAEVYGGCMEKQHIYVP